MKPSSQLSNVSGLQARDLRAALQDAVAEERNRLAREIHDTLAHALTGIKFQADSLECSLGADERQVRRALERIQELARSGLVEVRRTVTGLRPKALENSTLLDALEQTARRFSGEQSFLCEFRQIGQVRNLSARVEDELYRIVQEAMTNAKKHARAKLVLVNLEWRNGYLTLTVQDDGVGFAATGISRKKQGHGIGIMRERAQSIGGCLDIQNPVSGGAAVRVVLPLSGQPVPN